MKQLLTESLWPTLSWRNMNTMKWDQFMQTDWWPMQKINTWSWQETKSGLFHLRRIKPWLWLLKSRHWRKAPTRNGPFTEIFGTRRCLICISAHGIYTWNYNSSQQILDAINIPFVTVFLEHFIDCPYIVTEKNLRGEETAREKAVYEGHAWRHGVTMKHYHTDNSIFAESAFQEDLVGQQQTMSDCSEGAYLQNRHAEKPIWDP